MDGNRHARENADGTTTERTRPATPGTAPAPDTATRWSSGSGAERAAVKPFRLKPTNPTESQLHATVARYLDLALMPPAVYTTFPAGWGVLSKATAGRLRGAGLKQGMPDMLVFFGGRGFGIELKSQTGYVTPVQQRMHERLRAAGIPVTVCTTLEEVIEALLEWGLPLRWKHGGLDAKRETA